MLNFHVAIEMGHVEIKKNQTLEKFSDYWLEWGLLFKVEADITVNSLASAQWLNVFHFTIGGNFGDSWNGNRIPALFIDNIDKNLHLCFTGQFNFNFDLGQKYHILFQQYIFADKVIAEIKIDGNIINSTENNQAKIFPGVKLYIANPWYEAFTSNYGLLENFKITKYFM